MAPSPDLETPTEPQAGSRDAETGFDEETPLIARESAGPPTRAVSAGGVLAHPRTWTWQRWVTYLAALVIVLIFTLTIVFGVFRSRKMESATALCLTPACIHAASEILYNLSPNYQNVDPCANFDEPRHDMRPDQGSLNSFTTMAEDGQMILRHILEAPYPDSSNHSYFSPVRLMVTTSNADEDNFNQLQRAYNACMAETEIQKLGITPIQTLLGDLSKLLAVDDSAYGNGVPIQSQDSDGISEAILFLEKLDIPSLLNFGVGADDKDPDSVVVFAGPRSGVGLPSKTYYLDNDIVSQYQSAMAEVLNAVLPGSAARSAADKLAAAVVKLESQIAAATPELEDLQDVTKSYNLMSLKDAAALAPILGLEHVLTSLAPSNYTLDKLIASFPDYFRNVSDILAANSKDTIQAFLSWKVIQYTASSVIAPEVKPYTRFMNQLAGKDPDAAPERWRTCISHVNGALGWTLSRFYVEAAFSAKAKDLGNQIVSDIKEQFTARIKTLDWMDDEVKKLAIDKVNAIVQKIGYPENSPNITDPAILRDYYAGLNIGDEYFANGLSVSRWSVNQSWSELGKPTDREQWGMTAPTVNAYYNPAGNEIVFPAGIMQFPVFGSELPNYINYGAFGAVAGHELSHAFDNNGRHYDVHGNLTDWWTEHTVEGFEARAECFVDEYSNFTVAGPNGTTLHVKGRQTLGENIADAGGLSAAFNVWKKRQQGSPDLDLPGLDFFSQEQLFYISYGNFWCSKYSEQALTRTIYTDEHSPNFARIQGAAMLNSRGFREAFNCPVKEPVCELW
ncbi:zincin [Phialemonium atrogriseum]|uniref:Zincin n=1 Tax=Phialemonium atrogriseum TaxID=1093897 RepID=A0AAJ0CCA4_9PEZI|nr:zincin [Phialemonium atrogriseum]KAK1772594.1 zincin [Phialemonium atrogriseum]